jgi:probable rRNA maturation factor
MAEQEWEEESLIFFEREDIDFQLRKEDKTKDWILKIIEKEDKELIQLTYIFCSDAYLLQINKEYLNHDTYTDIITFPYLSPPHIEGDIFISIDRIKENAQEFNTTFDEELRRVMIHGVLHLCGYPDKTEEEAALMRVKEAEALTLWK